MSHVLGLVLRTSKHQLIAEAAAFVEATAKIDCTTQRQNRDDASLWLECLNDIVPVPGGISGNEGTASTRTFAKP